MKYYGKAQVVAESILLTFKEGNLPRALAPVFIRRKDGVPCRQWSWSNQLVCILNGTHDARGFRQWHEAGRYVARGGSGFRILAPCLREEKFVDPKTKVESRRSVLYGFQTANVFAVEATDGKELPERNKELDNWISTLPLIEVAAFWGLKVDAYDGAPKGPKGKYCRGKQIALGVKNLSTWAHEIMHAADDRLGHLEEKGQHWRSETVAEFGSAVLLEALGLRKDSDTGGSWEYVKSYADKAKMEPAQACMEVLKRTCEAVALLLEEAEKLKRSEVSAPAIQVAATVGIK